MFQTFTDVSFDVKMPNLFSHIILWKSCLPLGVAVAEIIDFIFTQFNAGRASFFIDIWCDICFPRLARANPAYKKALFTQ